MSNSITDEKASPSSGKTSRKRGLPLRGALAKKDTWLGQNWKTVLLLLAIFATALFIRAYFGFDMATNNGDDFLLSGGSDSYYHKRVIDYVTETGEHLTHDPMLNYPKGTRNPRPPLYDWSNVLVGKFLSPVLGMDETTSIWYTFEFSTAVWGALTIFPLYFMAREIFSKKTAFVSAIMLAVMAAHVERSILSNGDHDAFALFFITCSFFFFLKALSSVNGKKWVEDWMDWPSVKTGVRQYLGMNKRSLLYAVMAGLMLTAVALAWKGYAYALAIILIYLVIQLFLNMFRGRDSLAVTGVFLASIGTLLVLVGPYYVSHNLVTQWYDIPIYLYLGASLFAILFTMARDVPWIITLPAIIVIAGLLLLIVYVIDPNLAMSIITGAGYFVVQSKAYETIAEAQAPTFSRIGMAFGLLTFYLSIAGAAWMAVKLRKRESPAYIFIVAWTATSIFMALSAARFLFNASPAFAITSGWILVLIYEKMNFQNIIKTFRRFSSTPWKAFKKSVGVSQILVLLVFVMLVFVPNAWFAADAGIPYEKKNDYDTDVKDILPDFAQSEQQSGNWYFGAFGYSLPLKKNYYPAAYQWLAKQDNDIIREEERPAFISWWDYGFEVVQEGKHPTVADNFLGGHRLAGNFLMAQGEEDSIALLTFKIVQADYVDNDRSGLSPEVAQALEENGLNPTKVKQILGSGNRYIEEVQNHPEIYGPMDQDRLLPENAIIQVLRVYITDNADDVAKLYKDISDATGDIIRYATVDVRLFPFSASNTGIFYAPAKLSGRVIDEDSNTPRDFYEIKAVGVYGDVHSLDDIPENFEFDHYKLEYKERFFNSMLYKIYMGYSGPDVGKGSDAGLPGIEGDLQEESAMPGWMMSHYKMVYKTAYWNPYSMDEVRNHTDAWQAVNFEDAYQKAVDGEGVPDLSDQASLKSPGGVVMLKYYHGAKLSGKVTLPDGTAYPDISITVRDKALGQGMPATPHQRVETDKDGNFDVLLPFGDVEVVVSRGELDQITQVRSEVVDTASYQISDEQAMRVNVDRDHDGRWDYIMERDFVIDGGSIEGNLYWDMDMDDKYQENKDRVMTNAEVTLIMDNEDAYTLKGNDEGHFEAHDLLPGDYRFKVSNNASTIERSDRISIKTGESSTKNFGVKPSSARITTDPGMTVELTSEANGNVFNMTADANGTATFELLMPGNYSVFSHEENMKSDPVHFPLGEGAQKQIELESYESVKFTGTTLISGKRTEGVSLILLPKNDLSENFIVFSGENGRFETDIPPGEYSINAETVEGGIHFVHVGSTVIDGIGEHFIELERGHLVTGKPISADGTEHISLPVEFYIDGGTKRVFTFGDGTFSTYLPRGMVDVIVSYDALFFYRKVDIRGPTTITSMQVDSGGLVQGFAYVDRNDNGVRDAGEEIEGAQVSFVPQQNTPTVIIDEDDYYAPLDFSGFVFESATDEDGRFIKYLRKGARYYLYIDSFGHHYEGPIEVPVPKTGLEVALEPMPTKTTVWVSAGHVSGTLTSEFNVVTFETGSGETWTFPSYDESKTLIDLVPGTYAFDAHMNATEDDSVILESVPDQEVEINLGERTREVHFDVVYKGKVRLNVTEPEGPVNINIQGPENHFEANHEGVLETYLTFGEYTVSINQGNDFKSIFTLEVNGAEEVDYVLDETYPVSGVLQSDGERAWLEATVEFDELVSGDVFEVAVSSSTGRFDTFLPTGSYVASVDHLEVTEYKPIRYYRFVGEEVVTVENGSTEFNLELTRSLENTTYRGYVAYDGSPAGGVPLMFKPMDGGGIYTEAVTDSTGYYEVGIAPADYQIHSPSDRFRRMYLETFTVEHEQGPLWMNLSLNHSLKLKGVATIEDGEGSAGDALVIAESSERGSVTTTAVSSGYFNLYLPSGDYNLVIYKNIGEKNYTYRKEVSLYSDDILNPVLERNIAREVKLTFNDIQVDTFKPGETLEYFVTLKNAGEEEDVFNIQTEPKAFQAEVTPSTVTLGPDEWVKVEVAMAITENIDLNHESLVVKAISTYDNSVTDSQVLPFNVVERASFTLEQAETPRPWIKNGAYLSNILLTNDGNVNDEYSVEIINAKELADQGWNCSLSGGGGTYVDDTLSNITVATETPEATLTLKLTPTRTHPSRNVEVALSGRSQKDNGTAVTLRIQYESPDIELEKDKLNIEGDMVSMSLEDAFPYWTILLMISAVALAISGYLYYKGRRW